MHVDRTGLSAALEELAVTTQGLTGIPIQVAESAEVQVSDPEVAMHLFRIAQEAVANSVRHSGATAMQLSLEARQNHLELRIKDNGTGFNTTQALKQSGMGLRTMKYRAQALGAEFTVTSQPGAGTTVLCRLRVRTQQQAPL